MIKSTSTLEKCFRTFCLTNMCNILVISVLKSPPPTHKKYIVSGERVDCKPPSQHIVGCKKNEIKIYIIIIEKLHKNIKSRQVLHFLLTSDLLFLFNCSVLSVHYLFVFSLCLFINAFMFSNILFDIFLFRLAFSDFSWKHFLIFR